MHLHIQEHSTFNIQIIHTNSIKKKSIQKYVPTARNMIHILFHEQEICERGTKMEKCLLDEVKVK